MAIKPIKFFSYTHPPFIISNRELFVSELDYFLWYVFSIWYNYKLNLQFHQILLHRYFID